MAGKNQAYAERYAEFAMEQSPYIEKKDQLDIIESVRKVDRKKAGEIWTEINKSNYWFFNWNKSVNLERYLTKKEYRPAYE